MKPTRGVFSFSQSTKMLLEHNTTMIIIGILFQWLFFCSLEDGSSSVSSDDDGHKEGQVSQRACRSMLTSLIGFDLKHSIFLIFFVYVVQ
jgi:hypothetical protein